MARQQVAIKVGFLEQLRSQPLGKICPSIDISLDFQYVAVPSCF